MPHNCVHALLLLHMHALCTDMDPDYCVQMPIKSANLRKNVTMQQPGLYTTRMPCTGTFTSAE